MIDQRLLHIYRIEDKFVIIHWNVELAPPPKICNRCPSGLQLILPTKISKIFWRCGTEFALLLHIVLFSFIMCWAASCSHWSLAALFASHHIVAMSCRYSMHIICQLFLLLLICHFQLSSLWLCLLVCCVVALAPNDPFLLLVWWSTTRWYGHLSSDVKRYTINNISFVQIDIRISNCHSAYRKHVASVFVSFEVGRCIPLPGNGGPPMLTFTDRHLRVVRLWDWFHYPARRAMSCRLVASVLHQAWSYSLLC